MPFKIHGKYQIATFLRKGPRFIAYVKINNEEFRCHLPNPGRMREFLVQGSPVLVRANIGKKYKTPFTIVSLIKDFGTSRLELINLNTHVPVKWLCSEFYENANFDFFRQYKCVKREPTLGKHRFDLLLLDQKGSEVICEIKSTTKVINGKGFFPDAVSSRATKHVKALYEYAEGGGKAIILFIVQSDNVNEVVPDRETDPVFAQTITTLRSERLGYVAFTSTSYIENPKFDELFEGEIKFSLKRQVQFNLVDETHTLTD